MSFDTCLTFTENLLQTQICLLPAIGWHVSERIAWHTSKPFLTQQRYLSKCKSDPDSLTQWLPNALRKKIKMFPMTQEALGPCIVWPTNLSGIIFPSLHFFAPTTLAFFQFKNMPYSFSSAFAPAVLLLGQCSLPTSLLSHSYLTLHISSQKSLPQSP